MKRIVSLPVIIYQKVISPLKPPCCRFTPTCSTYMLQAIDRFGAVKGVLLGSMRILRCHPFCVGGYDPVPFCFTFSRKQLPRVTLQTKTERH